MTNSELDATLLRLYKQTPTAKIIIDNAIQNYFSSIVGISLNNSNEVQTNQLIVKYDIILYYGYGSTLSGNEFKQDNPNTSESILVRALISLGLKPQIEVAKKNNIKRVGRTDTSVSSLCQLFSCGVIKTSKFQKLCEQHANNHNCDINSYALLTNMLNMILNPFIFIYDSYLIQQEQHNDEFNPRTTCTSRTYKYLLMKAPKQLYKPYQIEQKIQHSKSDVKTIFFNHKLIDDINTQLLSYCGTHDFQYLSYETGPAIRTILSAHVKPVLFNKTANTFQYVKNNMHVLDNNNIIIYLLLTINGKAFAYHQIRILSSIINKAIINENTNIISDSLQQTTKWKHLEPGQRLCLVSCTYEDENMKIYEEKQQSDQNNNQKDQANVEKLTSIMQIKQAHLLQQKCLQILE